MIHLTVIHLDQIVNTFCTFQILLKFALISNQSMSQGLNKKFSKSYWSRTSWHTNFTGPDRFSTDPQILEYIFI